jgi:hypothetical protein
MGIPVTIIVATRNEEARLARCLCALDRFNEILVVDSGSTDRTCEVARGYGASVIPFSWNGHYPKKRQWCLDRLSLKHDWIFFVDADEIVTAALAEEIACLDPNACAGYFVRGRYIWDGRPLDHGLKNNKLVLFDRRKFEFPVVNDLDLPGMGEMEGHYQPVLKAGYRAEKIGQLAREMDHEVDNTESGWLARHERYAAWERGMNARRSWPADPVRSRQMLKRIFRAIPGRWIIAFLHCYVWRGGFRDGAPGLDFALKRARYYRMISCSSFSSRRTDA